MAKSKSKKQTEQIPPADVKTRTRRNGTQESYVVLRDDTGCAIVHLGVKSHVCAEHLAYEINRCVVWVS